VKFYGPESSGKTTLTLSVYCRKLKKAKAKTCAFIDAESTRLTLLNARKAWRFKFLLIY